MDRILNVVENNGVAEITIKGNIGEYYSEWESTDGEANTKDLMRKEIEALKNITASSILLKIDSYGGSVHHGLAMVNALRDTNKPIDVEYIGYSASAATFFASIARNVVLSENLMVLYHEGQMLAMGTSEEILEAGKDLERINNIILDSYVNQSARAGKNKTKEDFKSLIGRAKGQGVWSTADELLELGLITEKRKVYAAVAQVKRPTNEILNRFGLPEFPTNIINKQKPTNMGVFDIFKDKSLNMVNFGEVSAVTDGALKKGSELQPVNGAELKNGTYELEGFTVEITDNKVTNYTKISEQTEAVNIADFKNEFADLKKDAKEKDEATNTKLDAATASIEKLTELVTNLSTELSDLKTEGSPIDLTKVENHGEESNVDFDANAEIQKEIKAKAELIKKQRNTKI